MSGRFAFLDGKEQVPIKRLEKTYGATYLLDLLRCILCYCTGDKHPSRTTVDFQHATGRKSIKKLSGGQRWDSQVNISPVSICGTNPTSVASLSTTRKSVKSRQVLAPPVFFFGRYRTALGCLSSPCSASASPVRPPWAAEGQS